MLRVLCLVILGTLSLDDTAIEAAIEVAGFHRRATASSEDQPGLNPRVFRSLALG